MIEPSNAVEPDVIVSERDHQTRTRLLEAAIEIFSRKGYAAASVREIAEAARVTKPALYYHFGSKEGMLAAILDRALHEFHQTVAWAAASQGSARERLVTLCTHFHNQFGKHLSVAKVAYAVMFGPQEAACPADLTVFDTGFRRAVSAIITDGQASGEFTPGNADDMALAVISILMSTTQRQLHPAFGSEGVDVLHRLLNLLFDGILVPSRA